MVLKEKVNTQKHASWSEPNNILTRDLIDRHKEERERHRVDRRRESKRWRWVLF